MVDKGDMCEVNVGSRGTSPYPDGPDEDEITEEQDADAMDLDEDTLLRPATRTSRSTSDASAMSAPRYRRSSDWTSDRGSVTSLKKEPRIRKRSSAQSRARRR